MNNAVLPTKRRIMASCANATEFAQIYSEEELRQFHKDCPGERTDQDYKVICSCLCHQESNLKGK